MRFRPALAAGLIVLIASLTQAADKKSVRLERIGDVTEQSIIVAPTFSSADTCFVTENEEIVYYISGWVTGYELYKSYMDPAHSCDNPYPFTVTAINMPMMFTKSTPLTVAVDVEAIDSTTVPGCPVPGVLLAISSDWTATVPGAGWYNIWIPLDSPITVGGPFFAGVYLGSSFADSVGAAVLCDDVPVTCATYNIWDETVGWIDLCDNSYYNFPGRLAMEVAGIPGGEPGRTPELQVLAPVNGATLYGSQELWAWDRGLTGEIDYMVFEYSSGGAYIEIGRDFDGTSPLRDGVNGTTAGTGFSLDWDFSSLPEGTYNIRFRMVTNDGTGYNQTVTVTLEPTPPLARITTPADGSEFCTPLTVTMSTVDEDMAAVSLYQYRAEAVFSNGLTALNQTTVGDANGNIYDGNRAANGEFGDYYSGPVAAAIAAKEWYDRGRTALMMDGTTLLSVEEVAELLATEFQTRAALGTYDEAMIAGLRSYSAVHGNAFVFDKMRSPKYSDLRVWAQEQERVVILGVGGTPAAWLTLDGFDGLQNSDSTYEITVSDPLVGTVHSALWRDDATGGDINFNGSWQSVDIMISTAPTATWVVPRTRVGIDYFGGDGWELTWSPTGLTEGDWYFFRSVGEDDGGHSVVDVVPAEYDCSSFYVKGDYDNDQTTTLADLSILVAYISQNGAAPYGGAKRADCNCDNLINVADIIYYLNYLYGAASPPCR